MVYFNLYLLSLSFYLSILVQGAGGPGGAGGDEAEEDEDLKDEL